MDQSSARFWIEVILAATVPVGISLIMIHRIKREMGLGVRSIQFLAIVVLLPMIFILALEGILAGSAVGALFGALIGYLFTNIGKYDEAKGRGAREGSD
ncbi:hypothetical protein [Xanthobacter wiegelii]|uniref:hypothetical protein n=1 Tax=Xanthobacter wiegelii TaxID=3119913 RepID=UPI00372BD556